MALSGSCHCGAVQVTVPSQPEWLGSCNCSVCRRTAWLVAYYPDDGQIQVEGETVPYIWGDRMIAIHHCPVCACGTSMRTAPQWQDPASGMARSYRHSRLRVKLLVNSRPLQPSRPWAVTLPE